MFVWIKLHKYRAHCLRLLKTFLHEKNIVYSNNDSLTTLDTWHSYKGKWTLKYTQTIDPEWFLLRVLCPKKKKKIHLIEKVRQKRKRDWCLQLLQDLQILLLSDSVGDGFVGDSNNLTILSLKVRNPMTLTQLNNVVDGINGIDHLSV